MKLGKVVIILIVVLLLIGCEEPNMSSQDKQVIKELEDGNFSSEVFVNKTFKPRDDYFNKEKPVKIKLELTEMSKAKFWFDESIDLQSRKNFIIKSIDIISEMNKRYSVEKDYEYYISDKIYSYNDNNKIYIKYNNDKYDSRNFIIQTLYNIFGDASNYGLIFGEAIDLQKDLNICDDSLKKLDLDYIKRKLSRNNSMLDLTLPVFSDDYFNVIDIDYAKSIATNLVSYIKKNYGNQKFIKLLEASSDLTLEFDRLFATYMNEWLESVDVDVKKDEETVPIRYKIFGDKYFPVIMCTEWMQYCFQAGFRDKANYNYIFDFSYKSIKKFVALADQEMKDVRTFLNNEYTIDDSRNVISYFVDNTNCINYNCECSYCDCYKKVIVCNSISSYLHEYTHLISNGIDKAKGHYENFFSEGLAQYCNYMYDIYTECIIYNQYCNNHNIFNGYNIYNNYNSSNKVQFNSYLKSINIDKPNRGLFKDKNRIFDFLELICYNNYIERKDEIFKDEVFYRYTFGPVFAKYLIDNYGVEKYMEMYYNPRCFITIYPKNLNFMQKGFLNYLDKKYSKFVK